jgi:hypothetical protein
MAIVKHEYFKTKTAFTTAKGSSTDFDNSIVFIEDTMEVYTHGQYWTLANLSQYFDSSTSKLQLKNGNAVISEMDATPFIKDGMLDDVELKTTQEQGVSTQVPYLKFTFNTVKESASGSAEPSHTVIRVSVQDLAIVYNGDNVLLSNSYDIAQTYTAPAAGDKVDVAVGKLAKGVSDNATAIAGKQATITGAATTITSADLTASKALVSDANGKVAVSDTTATELGYVHGVTSAIQTQIDAKANITDIEWIEHA